MISTSMEPKEPSGATGQGRAELFLHLAPPRATAQEIQLLDGPPKPESHFQRDPRCVYPFTCMLFPSRRLSSWIKPLVVLVGAVCSACANLCAWHKYVCGAGFVYMCLVGKRAQPLSWWDLEAQSSTGLLHFATHDRNRDISPSEKWNCTSNSKILQ